VISFSTRRRIARIHAGDGPMEMSEAIIPLAVLRQAGLWRRS
jgi:hypothetical protein